MLMLIAVALLVSGCNRSGPSCPALQRESATYGPAEFAALPEIASIKPVREQATRSPFNEHRTIEVQAELGPFRVDYDVWDYKGQRVTTGATAKIRSPGCSNESFEFTMLTESSVRLRHDAARDLWIVSNLDNAGNSLVLRRLPAR